MEAPQSFTVRIDKTSPTIVANVNPEPNGSGWHRNPVTVSFSCADAVSGVSGCTNSVSISNEGANQSASGTATDFANHSASVEELINLDMTPPAVAYSGNASTYLIDQSMAISCSASDGLSGIASSTCAPITGPAYLFNTGNNTFSFTATDRAGNGATAQTSFQVQVTYDSLCAVTQRFAPKGWVADTLCWQLTHAESAYTERRRVCDLNDYWNLVQAQSGRAFTADQAAILKRLASALSARIPLSLIESLSCLI